MIDRGPEPFWDLLWLLTEEQTRKLATDQRDSVQSALTQHDEGAVEVLSREKDEILVRIGDVVFSLPLATSARPWEEPEPLVADPLTPRRDQGAPPEAGPEQGA